jgi:aldehyde:ferredoxin oxidoreductase
MEGLIMEQYGYAGKILRVDLNQGKFSTEPTSPYTERFIGGRGIGVKIYWDEVSPDVKAFDPDNRLIITTGPAAGFTRIAGSRWQIGGKSPIPDPETFSYANLGGSWGSRLKFAGYDALIIQGASPKPVYLYINGDDVQIRDASQLWGKTTSETRRILKDILGKKTRILITGPAGENLVPYATLSADEDSAGTGGFASVMGSKNLKAIAVYGDTHPVAADPERLQEIQNLLQRKIRMGPDTGSSMWAPKGGTHRQLCYGCIAGCIRDTYKFANGNRMKFFCQAAQFYQAPAREFYGDWDETIVHATRLCDDYGLDTLVLEAMILWLQNCWKEGILTESETGLPLSRIGSMDFIDKLVKGIALRQGFGDILALGTAKAAVRIGKGSNRLIGELITARGGEKSDYDPRLYIILSLIFALEPRRPIQQLHEVVHTMLHWLKGPIFPDGFYYTPEEYLATAERFWGSRDAADFTVYEGKALAVKKIQDRAYVKESLILCDFSWPILFSMAGDTHVGDPSLESKLYSAITGNDVSESALYQFGERIFNLQRAIHIREGWKGRDSDILPSFVFNAPVQTSLLNPDCLVPGPNGETVSRKGSILDKGSFEELKDEYYRLRGWDVKTGLQTRGKLEELGLKDVSVYLEKKDDLVR